MFIKNDNGEVVNIAKITAVTFDKDNKPYEMRVYTPAAVYGIQFKYETIEQMRKAADRLEKMLIVSKLRIIQFGNWWLMANDVDSISDCGEGLKVRMVNGQNFDIILRSREAVKAYKEEIEKSLRTMWSLKDLSDDEED